MQHTFHLAKYCFIEVLRRRLFVKQIPRSICFKGLRQRQEAEESEETRKIIRSRAKITEKVEVEKLLCVNKGPAKYHTKLENQSYFVGESLSDRQLSASSSSNFKIRVGAHRWEAPPSSDNGDGSSSSSSSKNQSPMNESWKGFFNSLSNSANFLASLPRKVVFLR